MSKINFFWYYDKYYIALNRYFNECQLSWMGTDSCHRHLFISLQYKLPDSSDAKRELASLSQGQASLSKAISLKQNAINKMADNNFHQAQQQYQKYVWGWFNEWYWIISGVGTYRSCINWKRVKYSSPLLRFCDEEKNTVKLLAARIGAMIRGLSLCLIGSESG